MKKNFTGAYTALITPFTAEDELDEVGVRHLIQRQVNGKINGVVILGTTGEAPTLLEKEKKRLIEITKQNCPDTLDFIIGTGSYSTKKTIEDTLAAQDAGADGALIVTPYYNKPTQDGLYKHFKAITEASSLPIIIYNIPGRCGQNLQTETLKRLIDIPSIVAIKEASGNISQIIDVIDLVKKIRPGFSVLSGDDALTLPLMALGGDGVISVISNLVPNEVKMLVEFLSSGNFLEARKLHSQLLPLIKVAFLETNPIPIKAMHQMSNLPGGRCRLPLCEPTQDNSLKIKKELADHQLLTYTNI